MTFSSSISETVTFEVGWDLGRPTGALALVPGQMSPQTTATHAQLGHITNQSYKMATNQLPFLRRQGQKQDTVHTHQQGVGHPSTHQSALPSPVYGTILLSLEVELGA